MGQAVRKRDALLRVHAYVNADLDGWRVCSVAYAPSGHNIGTPAGLASIDVVLHDGLIKDVVLHDSVVCVP